MVMMMMLLPMTVIIVVVTWPATGEGEEMWPFYTHTQAIDKILTTEIER